MIAAGSLRVFLAVSLVAAALCPRAWASAWALDPSATRIEFSVRNLSVARVDGTCQPACSARRPVCRSSGSVFGPSEDQPR